MLSIYKNEYKLKKNNLSRRKILWFSMMNLNLMILTFSTKSIPMYNPSAHYLAFIILYKIQITKTVYNFF
jgi:hypothetical protein